MNFLRSFSRLCGCDKQFCKDIFKLLLDSLPNTIYLWSPVLLTTISLIFLNIKGASSEIIDGIGMAETWMVITNITVNLSLNSGTSTLAAQAHGSKNFKRVGECLHRALLLRTILLLLGSLFLIWTEEILSHIGVDSEVAYNAKIYCLFAIPGIAFLVFSDVLKSYLIAHSIFSPLFSIQIFLLLIQVAFCLIFIYKLDWGIHGAAYAYSGTQLVGLILLLLYLSKCKETKDTLFCPKAKSFKITELLTQLKQEFWIGLFIFIEWMGYQIIYLLAGRLNPKTLQALVYMNNVTCGLYFLPGGVGIALGTHVAAAMGDGNITAVKRYIKVGIVLGVLVTFFAYILLFGIPGLLLRIYTEDEEVIEIGATLLRTYGCYFLIECQEVLLSAVLKAIGKEVQGAITYAFSLLGVGIASSYLLCFVRGFEAVGLLMGIGIGLALMLGFSIYLLRKVKFERQSATIRKRATEGTIEDTLSPGLHEIKSSSDIPVLTPQKKDEKKIILVKSQFSNVA